MGSRSANLRCLRVQGIALAAWKAVTGPALAAS